MKRKSDQRSKRQYEDGPESPRKKLKSAHSPAPHAGDEESRTTTPVNTSENGLSNTARAPEELSPTTILAREMVEGLAQYVNNAAFKDLPQDLRLLVARSQDLTKAVVNKPRAEVMTLPVELRLQIYRGLLVRPHRIECALLPKFTTKQEEKIQMEDTRQFVLQHGRLRDNTCKCVTKKYTVEPLLLVSKQISQEALDVLYGENKFLMHRHPRCFSLANMRRIKHPRVILKIPWALLNKNISPSTHGRMSFMA